MPKVAEALPESHSFTLEPGTKAAQRPVFEGVKVVYVGSMPNKSFSLPGRIATEWLGEKPEAGEKDTREGHKTASGPTSGRQSYDFSTLTTTGKALPPNFYMSKNHPDPRVAGKRFCHVEHGDHLWAMHNDPALREPAGKDGQRVFIITAESRETLQAIARYFDSKNRKHESEQTDAALIIKG